MAWVEKRRRIASAGSTSSSGDGRAEGHQVEDVPQGPRGATVDEVAVGPVVGVLPAAGRLLHRHHGQAVVAVELAVLL